MAGHLLLVNPRRRHRRRRMSALQRKYFGRRRHRRTSLSSNPRRRRRRAHHRRSHRRYALSINPRRRHRRRRYSLRRNPIRRHYRLRRNPTNGLSGSYSYGMLLSGGAAGAAGGVIVNWLFGALSQSFPRMLQPGTVLYPFLKIGAAMLIGQGLGSIGGRRFGQAAALGATTVVIYNQIAAPFAQQNFIPLGRYIRMAGLGSTARTSFLRTHRLRGIGRRRHGRGVYINGLGHMSPARIVRMRGMSRYVAMRGLRGPVNPRQASIPGRVGMLARFIRQQ